MDASKLFWCLYCKSSGRQIDGLTFAQARGFVQSLASSELSEWLGWHEASPAWAPIKSFAEMFDAALVERRSPPHPPPPSGVDRASTASTEPTSSSYRADRVENLGTEKIPVFELPPDGTVVSVRLDDAGYSDQRLNRRFLKNFDIEIELNGGKFQTKTVDVSTGGMLLQDALPPDALTRVYLQFRRANGAHLRVECLILPSQSKEFARRRLKIINLAGNEDALRTWLLESGRE